MLAEGEEERTGRNLLEMTNAAADPELLISTTVEEDEQVAVVFVQSSTVWTHKHGMSASRN